jgi:hypothetical protein
MDTEDSSVNKVHIGYRKGSGGKKSIENFFNSDDSLN